MSGRCLMGVGMRDRLLVRFLAQKLMIIHRLEVESVNPRWLSNVDWVSKIRKRFNLNPDDLPDTTIINWKAGGTQSQCWLKEIPVVRNNWLCSYLGFSPDNPKWLAASVPEFIEFYKSLR